MSMRFERDWQRDPKCDLIAAAFAIALSLVCVLQFNQYPLERFPNWDAFWADTQAVAFLAALRDAFWQGTLPVISPYTNFGWHAAGDTTLIASPFNPIHWLVLVMDPVNVITVRTIAYFSIAAFGVYLYFAKVFNQPVLGLVAGAAYLSLPMNYTLLYHTNMIGFVYFTPLLLVAIHGVIERRSRLAWFWFALWSALSTASSDVYGLIALPAVIGAYSFFVMLPDLRKTPARVLLTPAALVVLWLAVSSFYIVPFAYNVMQDGAFAREAAIAGDLPMTRAQFIDFLDQYVLWDGFLKPIDTVSIIVYVPIFVYCVLAASFTVGWFLFDRIGKRRLVTSAALFGAALVLFAESIVFYSIPLLSAHATGLLRVQIKLYSFLVLLASFLCLAEWARFGLHNGQVDFRSDKRTKAFFLFLTAVLIVSAAVDWLLFVANRAVPGDPFAIQHGSSEPFPSSNLIPLPIGDVWPLLPVANVLLFAGAVAVLVGAGSQRPLLHGKLSPRALTLAGIFCAALSCALAVSIHNDARLQQGRWAYETNSDYRIRSYRERIECLDRLTGSRSDPEFRTLYAGHNYYKGHNGRNWKAIAETELNVVAHEKVLFAYRNTIHPFLALARNAFGDTPRNQNLMPVTTSTLAQHLDLARFLGVRWIVSNDEPIAPELLATGRVVALGSCSTPEPQLYTYEPYQGGETYVYEIENAPGVTFLAPGTYVPDVSPKDGPAAGEAFVREGGGASAGKAAISAEGYGSFTVDADAPAEGARLVVSMIDRPHWHALVDGTPQSIERAFGGFMSVEVPAGRSRVEFTYRPYELWAGAGASFATLLLVLAASLWFPILPRRGDTDGLA
jgi:hypothetical protein